MTTATIPASLQHPATRTLAADRYLLVLCFILLGYAVDGRGFAYLFLGEAALAVGLVLVACSRGWGAVWEIPQLLLLVAFWVWGAARTVPYLDEYRFDAIRDAMLWGYSGFALIVAALIVSDPSRLITLLSRYGRFARIFLFAIPIVALVYRGMWSSLPRWPWAGVPVIEEKEGDVLVHLGGILAFWIAGLETKVNPIWMVLLTINVATMGVIDRAGVLAFGITTAVCAIYRPLHPMIWRLVGAFAVALFLLWATNIHIEVPGGKGREISFEQFVTNLRSMASDTGTDGLDSTKEWRMDWWHDIARYTIRGKYFWGGKGFGVNLADDDGFQVMADHSLRAPHSSHMDVLARTGVPGLVIWVILQGAWGVGVFTAFLGARRSGDERWQGVLLFLLALWAGFLVNSSFDVFFEGPMGAAWFWTIFGAGAAAAWLYRRHPQVLYRT